MASTDGERNTSSTSAFQISQIKIKSFRTNFMETAQKRKKPTRLRRDCLAFHYTIADFKMETSQKILMGKRLNCKTILLTPYHVNFKMKPT